jgi:hypothetical protein
MLFNFLQLSSICEWIGSGLNCYISIGYTVYGQKYSSWLSSSHHFESFTVATMTGLTAMEYLCSYIVAVSFIRGGNLSTWRIKGVWEISICIQVKIIYKCYIEI